MQIAHPILNSFHHLCKISDVYIHNHVLLDANVQKLLPLHIRTGTTVIGRIVHPLVLHDPAYIV